VDIAKFTPPSNNHKDKLILSVGRFFAGGHNKKHIEMINVFRKMCDRGEIPDGWEYHLVGKVHTEEACHMDYFSKAKKLAVGYPIKVLGELDFTSLLKKYYSALIFWHAAGWGENEKKHPDRHEHFGMSTCEAMSAGCIPVVIAKAGQLEIVENGKCGFTFFDEKSLIQKTRRLILAYGSRELEKLSASAMAKAKSFSQQNFSDEVSAFFGSIGGESGWNK